MSIDDIKDIKKLREIAKNAIQENVYLKECCIKAGKELGKHSFEWDGKEKNLVVQAMELNEKYELLKDKYNRAVQEYNYAQSNCVEANAQFSEIFEVFIMLCRTFVKNYDEYAGKIYTGEEARKVEAEIEKRKDVIRRILECVEDNK